MRDQGYPRASSGALSSRLLTVLAVSLLAAACASQSGPDGPADHGGFDDEPATTSDPGLDDRGSGTGGVDSSTQGLQTIYYGYDSHGLSSDAKSMLKHNADVLRGKSARVEIQGNCDERGTAEYNLALGKRRAESARQYLVDLGIDPSRIMTVSFGEENPAIEGQTESAWSRNRRADFVLR